MSGSRGWLRGRAVVSSFFTVAAAVCLVLAVVGGWAVYTVNASPGTAVEQRQQSHWSVDGEFHHSAEVTRENPAFETGETLRNRSTYFVGASPTLDSRFVATYAGTDVESASVTLDSALVVHATDGETVFWENRSSLSEPTTNTVQAGDGVAVAFSVNASELADRRDAIVGALGESPGDVVTYVAVDVAVEGTADGQPATLSFTHRLPITVDGDTYTVGPASAGREQLTTTEPVTITRDYGLFWTAGGPVLLIAGLVGLATLGVGRRRGAFELTPVEQELLTYRDERAEFDEWVVRMRLPSELHDRPRAEAESFADLVDFAIDSDTGVVEDPATGLLAVATDDFLAVYEPPAEAEIAQVDTDEGASGGGNVANSEAPSDDVELDKAANAELDSSDEEPVETE